MLVNYRRRKQKEIKIIMLKIPKIVVGKMVSLLFVPSLTDHCLGPFCNADPLRKNHPLRRYELVMSEQSADGKK